MSGRPVPILMLSNVNGFSAGQRVVATDAEASPPQFYKGTISSVWKRCTAVMKWDFTLNHEAERHLVRSGHVELHRLSRNS
jgi:hypothetical protein